MASNISTGLETLSSQETPPQTTGSQDTNKKPCWQLKVKKKIWSKGPGYCLVGTENRPSAVTSVSISSFLPQGQKGDGDFQ